jgi:hypothetical protein
LHLIERWPGGAGQARQISCQIFCHRRIYADSRRHRQLDALPENQQDSALADALRAIVELDLSELKAVEPPRGFGRD